MPLVDPVTMSSSTLAKSSSAPIAPSKSATIQPVPIFDTTVAKAVALARPGWLVASLIWRFPALVADPVLTLQTALPVVAAVQIAYAVVCLPVAGSQHVKHGKKARLGDKKKADASGPNPTVVSALWASGTN